MELNEILEEFDKEFLAGSEGITDEISGWEGSGLIDQVITSVPKLKSFISKAYKAAKEDMAIEEIVAMNLARQSVVKEILEMIPDYVWDYNGPIDEDGTPTTTIQEQIKEKYGIK